MRGVGACRPIGLTALLALGACGGGSREPTGSHQTPTPPRANAIVVEVIDGDTITIEIDGAVERVRLIGIDTPETKHPRKPIECYGPEASDFTASLLPIGTAILLERDLVGRDDYGRLLGYVHVPGADVFVNREIVRRGYAQPMTIEPNSTYADDFADDARAAERENLGIWAECAG